MKTFQQIEEALREIDKGRPLVFLDLETTGNDPEYDRIVSLAVLRVDEAGWLTKASWLLKPPISISTEAQAVHGISEADVADCPSFKDKARAILEYLDGDPILVGHNIRRFDYPVLCAEMALAGHSVTGLDTIDTYLLFKAHFDHTLGTAYRVFADQPLKGAHDVETDAAALPIILGGLIANCGVSPDPNVVCQVPADPNWIDQEGKFVWKGDVAVFGFGKEMGRPLSEAPKSYLQWMLDKDFSPEVQEIARKALGGDYPARMVS